MWLDEAAERALTQAVRNVENQSAVELAIAVRRSCRSWPHVPLLTGIAGAWATLAYMLYGTPLYALWSFLVDPLIAGGLAAAAASAVPPLVRWLTPASTLRRAVVEAARATFVERGVHHTRSHTGVLVYCSLSERMAAVIADVGVSTQVDHMALAAWERNVNASLAAGGVATADAIAAMGPTFARVLPRSDDDLNELPDAIAHDIDRRPRS